jgi:exodeoxyribonuclease VII small subunit
MTQKKWVDMNFEELMSELKKILDVLEKGELSLEESMRNYEGGVTLVRLAEGKLKNMEGRMEEIMADGSVKELVASKSEEGSHESA